YNASESVGFNSAKLGNLENIYDINKCLILQADGFEADAIVAVGDRCVNGNIPNGWPHLGGWEDFNQPCPASFWRTLVADRGDDGDNPPNWYRRACERVFRKSPNFDIDTTKLIGASLSDDKDFLLRVQSV